ncbi:MAG TPA: ATP-binding protein [Bradyrhizobium sp.]|nr:ATP-binding protein [Bradyrhizobium sp.]
MDGSDGGSGRLYWTLSPDALFAVCPSGQGQFLYKAINPAFEAVFGISSEKIRKKPVSGWMGSENASVLYEAFRTCLTECVEVRARHRLALGRFRRNIETVVTPIFDPDTGAAIGLIGSHRILSKTSDAVDETRAHSRMSARLVSIQQDIQQRIASDLHDSTCQHLIAASLSVMRIRASLADPANAERLCDDIDASIDHALGEIRAFSYLLHPQNPTGDGLKATIEQYVRGFAARTSLKVATEITPEVDQLSYKKQRSLLRIIQEALTNVFRHARATEVGVAIAANESHFRLLVRDNGRGIAGRARCRADEPSLGVGIPAMKARMQQLGGTLEIRSSTALASGTTLCAVFPHRLAGKPRSQRKAVLEGADT